MAATNPFLKIQEAIIKLKPAHANSPLLNEFSNIAQTPNPEPSSNIDYVFILSARSTYLGTPVDNQNIPDKTDDYQRVRLGVSVAKEVTARRLKKRIEDVTFEDIRLFGPTIVYNGVKLHNYEFVKSMLLNKPFINKFSNKKEPYLKQPLPTTFTFLEDYPSEKICILDLDPACGNTKGQFLCIKEKLKIQNTDVALITHGFHAPRVFRMVGKKAPLNPFGDNVTCYAFLVDRTFQANGAAADIAGEMDRIPTYISKKDLCDQPCEFIIYQPKNAVQGKNNNNAKNGNLKDEAKNTLKDSKTGMEAATVSVDSINSTNSAASTASTTSTASFTKSSGASTTTATSSATITSFTNENYLFYQLHFIKKYSKGIPYSVDDLELDKISKQKRKILSKTYF